MGHAERTDGRAVLTGRVASRRPSRCPSLGPASSHLQCPDSAWIGAPVRGVRMDSEAVSLVPSESWSSTDSGANGALTASEPPKMELRGTGCGRDTPRRNAAGTPLGWRDGRTCETEGCQCPDLPKQRNSYVPYHPRPCGHPSASRNHSLLKDMFLDRDRILQTSHTNRILFEHSFPMPRAWRKVAWVASGLQFSLGFGRLWLWLRCFGASCRCLCGAISTESTCCRRRASAFTRPFPGPNAGIA